MLRLTWRIATALAVGTLAVGPALAAHHEEGEKAEQEKSKQADTQTALSSDLQPPIMIAAMPVFVPPNMGAPAARLGGATRAIDEGEHPNIEALVPEAAGHTLQAQPTLYWYLAGETDAALEFVIRDVEADETVASKMLDEPAQPGIQRLSLADLGVTLKPGVEYFWMVKLVRNPDDRSYDRLTGGGIVLVEPSDALQKALAAEGASRPHALAEGGIWYDSVDAFSRQIDAAPGNATLWNQRAHLFKEVGLPAIPLEEGAAPAYQSR